MLVSAHVWCAHTCKRMCFRSTAKAQIATALPNGLNYGMMCAQGLPNKRGIITSSCKGDSGGPLTTGRGQRTEDRETLVGIVSGGIGCGKGVPGWYTKVSFFYPWINCIIQTTKETGGNYKLVTEKCDKVAEDLDPECIPKDNLIFDDFDLRSDDISSKKTC